ncbi:polyketide cyclase / dehydrase and lipid transport [uncultured Jatrophihabitans sp.]|uniref:polyketide cyclase / dehydrase and lipid transport n=1 Tax=uncultured Jatrophihabitans sp. TaxID=1610747 RepID=UPI0035CAC8DC
MPVIDVVDSTWIAARPPVVGAVLAQPANWRRWWPELELRVDEQRGEKGVRWLVPAVAGDRGRGLRGSAEVWLEPALDGVVAHFFLRLDPALGRRVPGRLVRRLTARSRRRAKEAFWSVGDALDPARAARLVC